MGQPIYFIELAGKSVEDRPHSDWSTTGRRSIAQVSARADTHFCSNQISEDPGGTYARRVSLGPKMGISNYEAEAWGLILALSRQATAQYLAMKLRRLAMTIKERMNITLHWSPGHEDIPLNEKVDSEAKKAIEEEEDQVQLCISLSFLKTQTKSQFGIGGVPRNRPPHGQAVAIFQLRSGHSPLRHYLKRIQAEETAACAHCGITETTAHFLVYCKASYSKARRILWNRLRKDKIKTNYRIATKLLDRPAAFKHLASFIEDTGRFRYLRSYDATIEST
ncbi:hypothetical protein CROQUDRAFT_105043 [Cronartium quercuum f. sp. fusiforme G11]|uniref:Uncharacterized protein n=1 Tax=Cronartium quercuum f. sp. fusiforme G11 TaxID=708437 RepID=A0A9P6TF96_9BASI|nr:hypothetical protein CROQUDRAFT_105043 [Cronartium quercuum f. sp. fusiforme G11]